MGVIVGQGAGFLAGAWRRLSGAALLDPRRDCLRVGAGFAAQRRGVHAVLSHQRRTLLPPGSVYQPGAGWRGSCGGCAPDGPYCSPGYDCWRCWPYGSQGGCAWLTVPSPARLPLAALPLEETRGGGRGVRKVRS